MCYAIPGKVVELKENIAVLNYFGERRNVLNEFDDIKIGDYTYAQGGIIINKISEKEALDVLNFWKDKFFELKKIDNKLAKITEAESVLPILQKINLNKDISKKELLELLKIKDKKELNLLFETANNIRQKEHDNACCVHGIIEFSNYCNNDCFYCGIRKSRKIKRYRMSAEEIINTAKYAANELGFKALVLQSGEDFWYDEKKLVCLVKEIRKLNVLIFLSIGIRSKETYKMLYEAGARVALLRFETSNKKLFEKLRPKKSFEERIALITHLKKIGYIIATGFLIGLPEETEQDAINNILLTKSLNPDMYSFGPFIPTKNTPLENYKATDKDAILKVIALTRLIDKKSKILVTTALETLDKDAKKKGLMAGANSLMINLTPNKYKKLYSIYDCKSKNNFSLKKNVNETIHLLYSLGRAPTDLGV